MKVLTKPFVWSTLLDLKVIFGFGEKSSIILDVAKVTKIFGGDKENIYSSCKSGKKILISSMEKYKKNFRHLISHNNLIANDLKGKLEGREEEVDQDGETWLTR